MKKGNRLKCLYISGYSPKMAYFGELKLQK